MNHSRDDSFHEPSQDGPIIPRIQRTLKGYTKEHPGKDRGSNGETYLKRPVGRLVPIKEASRMAYEELLRNGIIKPSSKLKIGFWIDGSTIARLNVVLVRCRF